MKWINVASNAFKPSILSSLKVNTTFIKDYGLQKKEDIELSPNSQNILERRYLRKNPDGTYAENIQQLFERVASTVAKPDAPYRDVQKSTVEYYNLLATKRFFPNSPTFTGAGTPLGQLAACFVLPVSDDLGIGEDSIFSTLRTAALIQQSGGGNGFSFSKLRPKGSIVKSSNGKASGPVGFMSVYDGAFGEVAQGGARRGANMGVLKVDHPDIREFIMCKAQEGKMANFNISVAITDRFMEAVRNDTAYELIDPNTKEVTETPMAREIFDLIVKHAHKNGEPGVLFIDEANRTNPVPHLYDLEATNPCGEQWLGPYENCCLGSLNLEAHLNEDGTLNWEFLEESVELATRFLDNVVSENTYVPSIPQLREAALNARRIGLGFMGLADVMYAMGVRYGSLEGQELAAQITEFIRYHSMKISIALAKERGPFLKIKGSIYDPENLTWQPPKPLTPYSKDFGRPALDWAYVVEGIRTHGIRNAAQTTVAPTGTISTVAGIEGYGCEPVFALAYLRNVYQAAGDSEKLTLTYVSPMFEKALDMLDLSPETRQNIISSVANTGSCTDIEDLPREIRDVFVVSSDITAEEHIMTQAAIQAFIDNSISKTCNFPEGATLEDVSKAYMLGWEMKCKGLTVYVTGSRTEVVLETKAVKDSKEAGSYTGPEEVKNVNPEPIMDRGYVLNGNTYKVQTPQGKAFITVNRDANGDPFEVFVGVGKAGSDVSALSEALGRSLSGWLRTSYNPLTTAKEIVSQLIGIGGARSVGFGKSRVSSIPDAIAKVLADDLKIKVKANGSNIIEENSNNISVNAHLDMCPDCGNSSLIREEGCLKCHDCGYSVC
ncbi:adenosylcobalamin-dependent ribonucleoside-diphosphate reductase [Candidatus Nomurabacteria bacterium]|nr:adenosylcobalamin-dependent ribonucleoside-diphosphate reductase [Candidatus Nomurabacteria bacterium]MCB9826937.1 adenosylcobalamin-dependent ribonucleoside-diphosphate reductase [Candidatus Nomurabacteria bacterium]MCB9828033.1 adenosylcobalamin-dependent ribonucleoside-diphosphate reductase [Candidatus Nomurabacteria bacterium]